MHKNTGFIIIEILLSLMLVASISLLLLKQQWQNNQFAREIQSRLIDLNQLANHKEIKARGFSLSEILIGLLLAGMLSAGLLQQYLQVYRQDRITRSQVSENLDLALLSDLLRSRLRVAGFSPCGNINSLRRTPGSLQAISEVTGGIEILRMGESYLQFASLEDIGKVIQASSIKHSELIIADCYHAEIYKNNHVLHYHYSSPIFIGELIKEHIYLNGRDIFYKLKHAEKLITGVAKFSVTAVKNDLIRAEINLLSGRKQTVFARVRSQ